MNYIHLVAEAKNENHPIAFFLPDNSGYNWNCVTPWFEYNVLTRDFISECRWDFSTIVKKAIFNNNYIYLYINEKYIPGTYWHSKGIDYSHSLLLHGYNELTNEVSFLIYDASRALSVRSIPMNEMEKAFYDNQYRCERYENQIYLLKLREQLGYKLGFDLKYMIEQLVTYRDEKPVVFNVLDRHTDDRYRYGLAVYDSMINYMDMICHGLVTNAREGIIIPMHLLMEHKHIMVERLKFLAEHYTHLEVSSFIEEFEYLKKSFESLRNNALKFELTGNPVIISKLIGCMAELKENERSSLTKLINFLESNYTESE